MGGWVGGWVGGRRKFLLLASTAHLGGGWEGYPLLTVVSVDDDVGAA